MARCKNTCTHLRSATSLRRVLISTVLILSSCAMVLFWTQSYPDFNPRSYTRNHEHTTDDFFTATQLLDQQAHELSSQDKLIRAVDKLPFKTMTPSSLLLEDMYFIPSVQRLVDYNNPVIHQPQINCSESTFLVILVPSHPGSVGERRAIRETWGSLARGRAWPGKGDNFAVKLVFVLGVAEVSFQPENIESVESTTRQQINAPRLDTDLYLTGDKVKTFSDRENNNSSVFMTIRKLLSLVNEKTGDANNDYFHKMAVHSLQTWRNRTATRLSNKRGKYNMGEDISSLLLKTDQSPQTTTTHSQNEANILDEISSFDDILQFDMIDTYANLTRKIILSLQLLLKTCAPVEFILKVDPDIFVNIPLLTTFLSRHGDKNSIYGHIYPNSPVERTGKWAVAKTALPISKYPIYAAGNAYVMSIDAVETIVALAPLFPYVLVEDAFITGILASVGRVHRVNVAGFTKWTEPRPDPCDFVTDKIYVGNNFTEYDHRLYWREIIDRGGYRCDV